MKSEANGNNTLVLEIGNISQHGLWLMVGNKEYFLDYRHYPWFKSATIEKILNVVWEGTGVIRWPDLDVDLSEAILANPDDYPLTSN